jgi:DNA repair photolyase
LLTLPGKFRRLSPRGRFLKIGEIRAERILTRVGGYLKGVCSHSLNPYVGCGFGRSSCGDACYVRFNPWLGKGRSWGGYVDVKVNAAERYLATADAERRWARKGGRRFSVFLSSATDPWQPAEQTYRITRQLLDAFLQNPPEVLILQSHSARMHDDVERFEALAGRLELRLHLSIEGDRERLPGLPPPPSPLARRLDVLRDFAARGLHAVACLAPLYPLRAPDAFFAGLARAGVSAVILDHFIGGDGTPDGSRTKRTLLPAAMARQEPASVALGYRDAMARVAARHLPVGISAAGFAGRYSRSF